MIQQCPEQSAERQAEQVLEQAALRSDAFLRKRELEIEIVRLIRAGQKLRRYRVNGRN